MTLRQVPVIDIAPFLGGEREGKARVAAEVRQACEDIGFFVITGHGVDPSVTKATHDVSRRFLRSSVGREDDDRALGRRRHQGLQPGSEGMLGRKPRRAGTGRSQGIADGRPALCAGRALLSLCRGRPALRGESLARASRRAQGDVDRLLGCHGAARVHADAYLRSRARPRRRLLREADGQAPSASSGCSTTRTSRIRRWRTSSVPARIPISVPARSVRSRTDQAVSRP